MIDSYNLNIKIFLALTLLIQFGCSWIGACDPAAKKDFKASLDCKKLLKIFWAVP